MDKVFDICANAIKLGYFYKNLSGNNLTWLVSVR